jgi:hypothetical protein
MTLVCGFFCLFIVKETQGLSDREVAVLYSKDKSDFTVDKSSLFLVNKENQA